MNNNDNQDNSDSFDNEVYEVERLLGHRITDGSYEYLIKWKNYSNEYNTWEKERNIFAKGLILDYWRSKGAMSRDTSPQVEENLKQYIINAKLSGKPPEGKTWDDVDHVVNVIIVETIFFLLKSNGSIIVLMITSIIHLYQPEY
ncbi:unnamed protein product [Rhizopus microsporus]